MGGIDSITPGDPLGRDSEPREIASAYSPDGVDISLIRWMLSLTPSDRLRALEGFVRPILRMRGAENGRR